MLSNPSFDFALLFWLPAETLFQKGVVAVVALTLPTMNATPTIASSSHTHVGTPPLDYHEEWETHIVHYHGFASLSTERNQYVESPEFMLLGNEWSLAVYPGGSRHAAEGMTSIFLWNMSSTGITIEYGFSINDGKGKQVAYKRLATPDYLGPPPADGKGWLDFAERSTLMNCLVNGTLIVEVHMRLSVPVVKSSPPPPFIPENSVAKRIQGLFLNEKYADIVFEVVGEEKGKDNAMKVAKTAPIAFPAHRLIVENCSSIFANLCESHGDGTTPIQIHDVKPDVFHHLLSFIYGMKISNDDMKSHAKEIIDAADKYGVVDLKLEAEACFVAGTTFTIENVMALLLYAESKSLALLKEVVMDYMMENRDEVIEKLSFADVPGTLVKDVLVATARGERKNGAATVLHVDSQYNSLRIGELRKLAHEKGLNIDGSREMLVAALKSAHDLESEVDSEMDSDEEEPVEE
jgi:hypothetical protein